MNVTHLKKIPCRSRSLRSSYAVAPILLATLLVSSGMSQDAADTAAKPPAASQREGVITQTELDELTDELVMLAVDDELRRSEAVDGHRIDVDVDKGIVTLSGQVSNLLAKEIAVGLAERVRGVVAVLDEMEVNTERRDNAALEKDVVDALSADPATHRLALKVVADENVVTLSGTVPSNGEKTLAGEVAMGVKGVIELENEINVESKKTLTDKELQAEISELFKYAALLDDVQLEVEVKDGVAVLNGRVASSFQKSHADYLAYRAGATDVDSRGVNVNWRHTDPLLRKALRARDGRGHSRRGATCLPARPAALEF